MNSKIFLLVAFFLGTFELKAQTLEPFYNKEFGIHIMLPKGTDITSEILHPWLFIYELDSNKHVDCDYVTKIVVIVNDTSASIKKQYFEFENGKSKRHRKYRNGTKFTEFIKNENGYISVVFPTNCLHQHMSKQERSSLNRKEIDYWYIHGGNAFVIQCITYIDNFQSQVSFFKTIANSVYFD